jgi:hypothetical protein
MDGAIAARSASKVLLGHGDERDLIALITASNEGRLEELIPGHCGSWTS